MEKLNQYLAPAICLVVGVIVSIFSYFQVQNVDITERRAAFEHQADIHFSTVEEQLFATQDILISLKAFIENNSSLKRTQFNHFAKALMNRHQDIQALEWIPKIPEKKKSESEQLARSEGLGNFAIKERVSGNLAPVSSRDFYYPVYYVYPYESNKAAVGFDLGSNPARLKALEQARDTGKIVMTRKITLVQETASQAGVLMFLAMYEGNSIPETMPERRQKLKGFALAVIRVGDLIVQSRSKLRANIEFLVTDPSSQETLFDSRQNQDASSLFTRNYMRDVGLREWSFNLVPTNDSVFLGKSPQKWITLIGVLIIAALLSLYLLSLVRSRDKVQQEVSRRTEELQQSEQRFALATEGSSVGIWEWRYSDDKADYWSQQFYALLGLIPEDLIANVSNFRKLVHPDDIPILDGRLKDHIAEGHRFELEIRLKTKASTYKWFLCTGTSALDDEGKIRRMVGSIQDIHARKSAEIAINAYAEDLKRSNADLEQFAYVASHDLKAPLRGIHNLAVWIEENIRDAMDEETESYMVLLKKRIKRLETLLASLLEYSRTGQNVEEQNESDLNDLVLDVSELLSVSERGFEIKFDLPKAVVPTTMLNQVLQNLINNAIKHHDSSGGQIEVSYELTNSDHIFTVSDDGPGIPEEMYDKVFEMFQTLRPRDEVEGSGMGLAIVKKLVNCYGGKIWLESTSGSKGTAVKFTIPRVQKIDLMQGAYR